MSKWAELAKKTYEDINKKKRMQAIQLNIDLSGLHHSHIKYSLRKKAQGRK